MTQTTGYDWMLAEIRIFALNYTPHGWVPCNGQMLSIVQFPSLFSLIGITFGGDGKKTFALPDLRGRVLLHRGNGYEVGKPGGEATHVLTEKEMPSHTHQAVGSSNNSDEGNPKHNFWPADKPYRTDTNTRLHDSALGMTGGNQPHENMAPYLSLNYCIALEGDDPRSSFPEEFVGIIKTFPMLRDTPRQWEVCDGRELPIAYPYTTLFAVIGTTYGGNGTTTFKLPDLRGRTVLNQGKGDGLEIRYKVGDTGGSAQTTLNAGHLPAHTHTPSGKIEGAYPNASANSVWANGAGKNSLGFATDKGTGPLMKAGTIGFAGGFDAHNNMMPYQVMTHYIAIDGFAPPKN